VRQERQRVAQTQRNVPELTEPVAARLADGASSGA